MIRKIIGKTMFAITGWKLKVTVPREDIDRCVMIAAPHTSNWDFYYLAAAMWATGLEVKFLIKDDYTKPWYGYFFKKIGAVGVNRSNKKNNIVSYAANYLKSHKKAVFIVPPEGTRKRVAKWKKGFYYMAKESEVSIACTYLDFEKKEAGIGKLIVPSDDWEKDFLEIEKFYKNKIPKYPELYNTQIFERDGE